MRARDLAQPYPVLRTTDPARTAAELLARADVDVALVQDPDDTVVGALYDIGLLASILPPYVLEDRALARVLGDVTEQLWARADGLSVADLLAQHPAPLPTVPGDATLVEVAAQMVADGVALVAVREGGAVLGGITTSAVLTQLLGAP